MSDIRDARIVRVGHRHLIERVWALRQDVTTYDASYAALAEMFGVPLLTLDARLARSSGHRVEVAVYGSS